MILDRGICSIYRKTDISEAGGMPQDSYMLFDQSWYGELNFETSPQYPTGDRKERRTDARIRIHQNRGIMEHDVAVLADVDSWDRLPAGTPVYEITRCYHATDDDGPTPITDLSLEVAEV